MARTRRRRARRPDPERSTLALYATLEIARARGDDATAEAARAQLRALGVIVRHLEVAR